MTQEQIQRFVRQSRDNDPKAFARLVAEFQPFVFRLAFRLLCIEDEAKDMVQETFIKVWLSLDKYDSRYKFSTWLYKVTVNTCYDRMRVLQHLPEGSKSDNELSSLSFTTGDSAETIFINKELKEIILQLTSELTPKQKLVFTLRDIEELEISEIVTITGLSPAKIKSNLYLARKQIKNRINELEL